MTKDEAFRVFDLTPPSSEKIIKDTYRGLVKVWHPDRFPDDEKFQKQSEIKLKRVIQAYEILLDSTPPISPLPPAAEHPPRFDPTPKEAFEERIRRAKLESGSPWIRFFKLVAAIGVIIGIVWAIGIAIAIKDQKENDKALAKIRPLNDAISAVTQARTLDEYKPNGDLVVEWVKTEKGPIKVIGWDAQRMDDQNFLVSYLIDRGTGPTGWFFEYNSVARIVRGVNGNPALKYKYLGHTN